MIQTVCLLIFVALPAIILHEYAHGWVAARLGDTTAQRMGRLTLNPFSHIDLVGTILVPVILYSVYALGLVPSLVMFGWAKPVPVNFFSLRNPRRDMILVALAGPLINILLAIIFAQCIRFGIAQNISLFLFWGVLLNLGLAVFNLLPIPPLDGSRVLSGFLSKNMARQYTRLEPFGLLVLIVFLNLGWLRFVNPFIVGLARFLGLS